MSLIYALLSVIRQFMSVFLAVEETIVRFFTVFHRWELPYIRALVFEKVRGKVKVQLIPNQSQDHELLSGLNSYSYRFVIELSGNPRKSSYLNMNEREGTQMQPMHVAMYLLLNVKICLPLFVKNSTPTNPPAKKITNIPTYGNHVVSYCHVYITYMYVMFPTGHFHLIFTIIELSFSGLLDAFKHLSVKNEQRKFQSKENKSILEM